MVSHDPKKSPQQVANDIFMSAGVAPRERAAATQPSAASAPIAKGASGIRSPIVDRALGLIHQDQDR